MMTNDVSRCTRCILPASFPDISFDGDGVCNHCLAEASAADQRLKRQRFHKEISDLFAGVKDRNAGAMYDCVVAYSGGKDSSYTLKILVEEFDLRCLAVTIDNGFLSSHAVDNCRVYTDALGVDHIFFKPAFGFMQRMYRASLGGSLQVKAAIKRASEVCNSCINLVNTCAVNVALQHGAPIIAGGYLGGQLPKGRAYLEVDPKVLAESRRHQLSKYEKQLGAAVRRYFAIHGDGSRPAGHLYIVNPLVAIDYDEDKVIAEISEQGWKKPMDTGLNSTNCRLNDLGIYSHYKRHGFHPYEADLAQLVRDGLMSREKALAKVRSVPSVRELQPIMNKLGVGESDL